MVLAAGLLRIPAALTEADAAPRPREPARRAVREARLPRLPVEGLDGPKYRGRRPPDPGVARARPTRAAARAVSISPPTGRSCSSSAGARARSALNEAALEAFADEGPAVLHLAGERDYPELERRPRRPDYRLLPFTDDFGAALAAADLVVARAGGSVWEVAAAGKPALLVPYPHATADHQAKNARYFERGGGAVVVPEPELDLRRQVGDLLGDPARLEAMGEAMRALAKPDAAEVVAEELMSLARP